LQKTDIIAKQANKIKKKKKTGAQGTSAPSQSSPESTPWTCINFHLILCGTKAAVRCPTLPYGHFMVDALFISLFHVYFLSGSSPVTLQHLIPN